MNNVCNIKNEAPQSQWEKGVSIFTKRFAALPTEELDRIIEDEKFGPAAKMAAFTLKFNKRLDAQIRAGKKPASSL